MKMAVSKLLNETRVLYIKVDNCLPIFISALPVAKARLTINDVATGGHYDVEVIHANAAALYL